jgi:mitotic-spindle organizing protein 1|eukprot:7077378-Prymnesium_polylepis.2
MVPCDAGAVLFDISQLLQTGLDRETLGVLVGLTETGVNPEALAAVVHELRRESAALHAAENATAQAEQNGAQGGSRRS